MKILFYILCFDDSSELYIQQNLPPVMKPVSKILRLPPNNKYLEFYFFSHYLLSHQEEWQDMDYVGSLSWKYQQKIPPINLYIIEKKIKQFHPDLFSFYNVKTPLLHTAEICHPSFKKCWNALFQSLGYTEKEYNTTRFPSFFCNYWIAKSSVLHDFAVFASSLIQHIESTPSLQELLYTDSNYKGNLSTEQLLNLFQKPYYPMICFILERVICFYAYHHKLSRMI